MVEIKDKLEAVEFFIAKTNVNYNSTTLWHSIDDILNGYIPDFFMDNLNAYKIGEFIKKGFQVKPDQQTITQESQS